MPTAAFLLFLALAAPQPAWAQGNGNGQGNGNSGGNANSNAGGSSIGNANSNAGGNGNANANANANENSSNPQGGNAGGQSGKGIGVVDQVLEGSALSSPDDAVSASSSVELSESEVLAAVEAGTAVALSTILPDVRTRTGGEVINAQLEQVRGFLLYAVTVLTPEGKVTTEYYYARSGQHVEQ